MTQNLTPTDYFGLSYEELQKQANWPFSKVTVDEFWTISSTFITDPEYSRRTRLTGTVLGSVGIVTSALAVFTLWRKTFVESNLFFRLMFSTSALDLAFNLFFLVYSQGYRTAVLTGGSSWIGMWLLLGVRGSVYCFSLASDFCTLWLTVDRYLAVAYPHWAARTSNRLRRCLQATVAALISLLSAVRCHYGFTHAPVSADSLAAQDLPSPSARYVFRPSASDKWPLVIYLALIADMILPFVMVSAMIMLSLLLFVASARRHRRSHVPASLKLASTIGSNGREETRKAAKLSSLMIVLVLALDALYILNQGGYCVYALADTALKRFELTFDDQPTQLGLWVFYKNFYADSGLASVALDGLSHSLNFPLYLLLSKTIKMEFVQAAAVVRRRIADLIS